MINNEYPNQKLADEYLMVCKHLGSANISSFKRASYRIKEMSVNITEYYKTYNNFDKLGISHNVGQILKIILDNGLEKAIELAKEENIRRHNERVEESKRQSFMTHSIGREQAGKRTDSDYIITKE